MQFPEYFLSSKKGCLSRTFCVTVGTNGSFLCSTHNLAFFPLMINVAYTDQICRLTIRTDHYNTSIPNS